MAPLVVICCQTALLTALSMSQAGSLMARASGTRALDVAWRVSGQPRGTPAVRGDLVYFLSRHHEIVAIDKTRGEIRWTRQTGSSGPATGGARVLAAPLGIVAGDDGVVAFDEAGNWLWRFDAPDGGGPGYYLGDVAGDLVMAGSSTGWVYGLDVATGAARWSRDITGDRAAAAFAPAAAGDGVIVGFPASSAAAAGGIVCLDAATGEERWRALFSDGSGRDESVGFAGGPLAIGQAVVVAGSDGRIHVLDRVTGRGMWTWPPVDRRAMAIASAADYRPLARVGRTLVSGSLSGVITGYDLLTGRERWRRLPHLSSVAFGIAGGRRVVLVPHLAGPLVVLDADDGRERGRTLASDGRFEWVPAVSGGRAYAASSQGYVALVLPEK